jgi:hypothetical protein
MFKKIMTFSEAILAYQNIVLPPFVNMRCFSFVKVVYLDIF